MGPLGSPADDDAGAGAGLLGYTLTSLARLTPATISATFTHQQRQETVSLTVPAGPAPLRAFPFANTATTTPTPFFAPSPRFVGLLTTLVQAHALGWDASLVPPAAPATASASTSTLVRTFGEVLGYGAGVEGSEGSMEAVHLYKELGGRELLMRRRILDGGATTWEPRCAWSFLFLL